MSDKELCCQEELITIALDPSEKDMTPEVMDSTIDAITNHLDSKGYSEYAIFWNGKGERDEH